MKKELIKNSKNINIIKVSKFKFVNIQIMFMFDLNYEDIATLNILHNLLVTRNSRYPTFKEFNIHLEENYGMNLRSNFFNRGNVGFLNIYSSCMNSKYSLDEDLLKTQVNTLKECLFTPVFTQEALDEIKMIYIEKLKESLNRKTYILKKKINENLGKNTPYGINAEGDIETISNVTLEKIREVYEKVLSSNCQIYVCGDVEDDVLELFNNFKLNLGEIKPLDLSYLRNFENLEHKEYESSFLQSAISIMYQCDILYNDPLYFALKVFIEMLNFHLFKIIREEYNYCYYIYAISNNYLNTFEIVSEIESKNLDKVVELIEAIISSYDISFNEEQFLLCKNKILTSIKTSLDSPRDTIDLQFGFNFIKNVSSIEELENAYKNVTAEQVKEVSKKCSLKLVSILKEATHNG